jgi:spore coat polysaccharide biosynthesis protein SpsF
MQDLAARVDAAGARIPSTSSAAGRVSRVVLSARAFDDGEAGGDKPAERAERLRALIADAIERGVTHVDVGRADGRSEELLRSCAEPALVKRFGLISRLWAPALEDPDATDVHDLAVEASVERSFANLGRRGVDALVFPDAATAARGWARAQRYRADGEARSIGLVARSEADLAWAVDTPDVGFVEVHTTSSPSADAMLGRLAARGTTLVAGDDAYGDSPEANAAGLPDWATAVMVTALEPAAFDGAVAAVNR